MATVTKRGKGYRFSVSCGYSNGRQIRKTMTWTPPDGMPEKQIEKELERQKALFEEKCKQGQVLDGSIKFADFVDKWFEDYAATQLRATTVAGYRELLKRIIPAIGHIRLDRLQPHHLQEFYRNLAETGVRADGKQRFREDFAAWMKRRKLTQSELARQAGVSCTTIGQLAHGKNVSADTAEKVAKAAGVRVSKLFEPAAPDATLSNNSIKHYHQLISSILSTAVKWQVIYSNPCDRVQPPKVQRKEAEYLDDVQTAHMLELLDELPPEKIGFKTAVITLLFTGLRRGELLGLHWSDIDMETGVISINQTLKYLSGQGVFEDETKTASSHRSFKAPSTLFPLLRQYHAWQLQQRLVLGDQWHESNFAFVNWDGTPMRPDTLSNQFRDWIRQTDLPPVHIHSLRHTNATLLIANGTNLQTVSKRLGHSTSSTTANIYAHAIQSADAAAAEAVEIFNTKQRKA